MRRLVVRQSLPGWKLIALAGSEWFSAGRSHLGRRERAAAERLLGVGGHGLVLPSDDPLAVDLALVGEVEAARPVRVLRMEPNRCHDNASALARDGKAEWHSGWGLNAGVWRRHSWGRRGDVLIETTEERETYLGAGLKEVLCPAGDLPIGMADDPEASCPKNGRDLVVQCRGHAFGPGPTQLELFSVFLVVSLDTEPKGALEAECAA